LAQVNLTWQSINERNLKMKKQEQLLHPYPVWIIDNFLDDETASNALNLWPKDSHGWHGGHKEINGKKNILEHGIRALSSKDFIPKFYLDLINELNSQNNLKYYEKLSGIRGLLADQAYRWSGLREMEPGGYQLIHSDARQHPETGFTKALTHLLYLNDKTYVKDEDEGCLEIWSDDLLNKVHEIEPIHNRMVIFLNSNKSYHGVPKNNCQRKMITFSTITDELSHERSKALFVGRNGIDSPEVTELGKKRADVKDRIDKI
tara:strand:- start:868 stop:1650 length:783 start_codon:yes stop_codon:yes gene_type:complete